MKIIQIIILILLFTTTHSYKTTTNNKNQTKLKKWCDVSEYGVMHYLEVENEKQCHYDFNRDVIYGGVTVEYNSTHDIFGVYPDCCATDLYETDHSYNTLYILDTNPDKSKVVNFINYGVVETRKNQTLIVDQHVNSTHLKIDLSGLSIEQATIY